MRLIALKRMSYNKRDYQTGEEFDTLTDRDARALTMVRAARAVDEAPKQAAPVITSRAMQPNEPPIEPQEDQPKQAGKYNRRDMRAKG